MHGEAPIDLTDQVLRTMPLPAPGKDKEARGRAMVVGGSATVPGAALLAGEAALRAGAGKLQLATVSSVASGLALALPEAMVLPLKEDRDGEAIDGTAMLDTALAQCASALLGPGMQPSKFLDALVRTLIKSSKATVVLDAGALGKQHIAPPDQPFILTPHAGEMAELCEIGRSEAEAEPLRCARHLAEELNSVIVHKGPDTYIADPHGNAWLHRGGVPGLGTSGSGDVLAGIIAGLAARGAPAVQAALWGVWIHAQAGRELTTSIGKLGFLARELPAVVPALLDRFPYAGSTPN